MLQNRGLAVELEMPGNGCPWQESNTEVCVSVLLLLRRCC